MNDLVAPTAKCKVLSSTCAGFSHVTVQGNATKLGCHEQNSAYFGVECCCRTLLSREAELSSSAHSSHTRALPEHERGLNAQDKHGHAVEGGGVLPPSFLPTFCIGAISFIPFCDEEGRKEERGTSERRKKGCRDCRGRA